MDNHLKKSELDIKELETSLKFQSGSLGLHIPTLDGRAGVFWGRSWAWDSDLYLNHNGGSRLKGYVHLSQDWDSFLYGGRHTDMLIIIDIITSYHCISC